MGYKDQSGSRGIRDDIGGLTKCSLPGYRLTNVVTHREPVSRAAAKHTTVAERKCTTGVMPEGADLGVGVATGTVVGGRWED